MTQNIRVLCIFWVFSVGCWLANPSFAQDSSYTKPKLIVFPALTRSIETSWAGGGAASYTFKASRSDTSSRTSSIQMALLYSLKKQLITAVKGTQYLKDESWILQEHFSYSSFPDKFWGLGKDTKDAEYEDYSFQQMYLMLHPMRKIAPNWFAGLLYEYQRVWNFKYPAGGLFDQQQIKGRHGYHVSGAGLSLTYDSRDHAFWPTRGSFAQAYFNHYSKVTGSDFTFTNFVLDFRKFFALSKKSVFATQAWIFGNIGDDVPYRNLALFGGNNAMRGYYEGRFRDLQQFVLQGEYRQELIKRFGFVLFGGIGNVAHRVDQLNFNNLKYSIGGGMRYALNPSERLNLRIDYGIGKGNNSGFYFQLSEAF
jgi:outer membrane protein assembly factor BamA